MCGSAWTFFIGQHNVFKNDPNCFKTHPSFLLVWQMVLSHLIENSGMCDSRITKWPLVLSVSEYSHLRLLACPFPLSVTTTVNCAYQMWRLHEIFFVRPLQSPAGTSSADWRTLIGPRPAPGLDSWHWPERVLAPALCQRSLRVSLSPVKFKIWLLAIFCHCSNNPIPSRITFRAEPGWGRLSLSDCPWSRGGGGWGMGMGAAICNSASE